MVEVECFSLNNDYIDILKKYKLYLLTNKHLSDNSVDSYLLDIYKYLEYMEKSKINSIKKIKKEDIYNYLKSLDNKVPLT